MKSKRIRPKNTKNISKKTTVKKRVNKKGYTNKYGTRVGPYNRKVSRFPNTYTIYRIINGEYRVCKITRKNGKEYVQVLDDKRRAKPITFAEAKKHFAQKSPRSKDMDLRYKSNEVMDIDKITTRYLTSSNRLDVKGLDTPPTREELKEKEMDKKTGTAQKLVEREFERSDARKELEPLKTKFKLKENEWTIEELGNSKYFLMDKDRIIAFTTREQFKASTLGYMRQDNFEEVDLENSKVILTGGEYDFLGFGEKDSETLYLRSYINNAIKNLKNPKIYYREDYPLVIEGDDNVMVLAPKVTDDDKYISEQYDSILPYKEYKQISKKMTKKELIKEIKEIDPEREYKKGENKDNLIKDYYTLNEREKLATNIINLKGVIEMNERELENPTPNYYRSDYYNYDFDPVERQKGIDKQKQELENQLNQFKEQYSEDEYNILKRDLSETMKERYERTEKERTLADIEQDRILKDLESFKRT